VTLLCNFIAIKAGCFRYKRRNKKTMTSSRDVTITKICDLRYVGKSKYVTIKAKNWLCVIICLQILKKCSGYLPKMLLWRHFWLPKEPHFLSIYA